MDRCKRNDCETCRTTAWDDDDSSKSIPNDTAMAGDGKGIIPSGLGLVFPAPLLLLVLNNDERKGRVNGKVGNALNL